MVPFQGQKLDLEDLFVTPNLETLFPAKHLQILPLWWQEP